MQRTYRHIAVAVITRFVPGQDDHIGLANPSHLVLLGKKEEGPDRSFRSSWHLPSEEVEGGETPEQAALRCAWSETGLKVTIRGLIHVEVWPKQTRDGTQYSALHFFHCDAGRTDKNPAEAKAGEDLTEVKWVRTWNYFDELGEAPRLLHPVMVRTYIQGIQ